MSAPTLLDGHPACEHHLPPAVEAPTPPPATDSAQPIDSPLAGVTDSRTGHGSCETHSTGSGAVPNSPQAIQASYPIRSSPVEPHVLDGHSMCGTHHVPAVEAQTSPSGQRQSDTHPKGVGRGPILQDEFIGMMAATVTDLEGTRKALANRYLQLTRPAAPDKDGRIRGLGLDKDAPEVMIVHALLLAVGGEHIDKEGVATHGGGGIEHEAVLKLNARMRKHPLWQKWGVHQKGVGQKTFARLLASIGDPYWNGLHERPRKVSELIAYCGLDPVNGVAKKKARGQKVTWSEEAKMRVWNVSVACLKAKGGYADVYREGRLRYAESVHNETCVRCGPKGKPALAGSPLSDGHKHARAIRLVSKEILKDLWLAAKELHETPPADQSRTATASEFASAGGQK